MHPSLLLLLSEPQNLKYEASGSFEPMSYEKAVEVIVHMRKSASTSTIPDEEGHIASGSDRLNLAIVYLDPETSEQAIIGLGGFGHIKDESGLARRRPGATGKSGGSKHSPGSGLSSERLCS